MLYPECEIFKKRELIEGALEHHGFSQEGGAFILHTRLPKAGFDLAISITPSGGVEGHAFDPDTGDEYLPLHAREPQGAFASQVQDEYRGILQGIAASCFRPRRFMSDQANRLEGLIREAFGDVPDNPFSDLDAGAFRTPGGKWYALVMAVPRSRIMKESAGEGAMVEIANLKADPGEIPSLVSRDGIIPAYHMNKRYWISVLLDGTLDDRSLMELVSRSRDLVMGKGMPKKAREG